LYCTIGLKVEGAIEIMSVTITVTIGAKPNGGRATSNATSKAFNGVRKVAALSHRSYRLTCLPIVVLHMKLLRFSLTTAVGFGPHCSF